jgi:hypothetical protein
MDIMMYHKCTHLSDGVIAGVMDGEGKIDVMIRALQHVTVESAGAFRTTIR